LWQQCLRFSFGDFRSLNQAPPVVPASARMCSGHRSHRRVTVHEFREISGQGRSLVFACGVRRPCGIKDRVRDPARTRGWDECLRA
jgi:hypothetical protein